MIDYKNELNPQQLEAVTTINGPVVINAGAGSGKTRTLTYRTMYLIEHGINPKNILLLTFTNKAADEMKQRICSLVPFGDNVTASTFHSSVVECKVGENDHVHCFVSAPPKISVTQIVKYLKGISGTQLFREYPQLRKSLWKGQLWNGSYFCETIGSTSEENILRYIERQKDCQL